MFLGQQRSLNMKHIPNAFSGMIEQPLIAISSGVKYSEVAGRIFSSCRNLPTRWSNTKGFHNDSSVAQIGKFTARTVAREITENYWIDSVYSSPALRCIQTIINSPKFFLPPTKIKN
uniref:Uncharacterized protein n=1 Tax=Onchocerca volvulus TaxID=6282 RepID=A0A8R1XYA8_ONCVO